MATIRDVSKAAGVSRATVTRVLQDPEKVAEKTRTKVLAVIEELGYRPNMLSQTFRNKKTKTIVVLVPNIANPVFAKMVSGIEAAAKEKGYSLLLGDTHSSPEREAHYVSLVETKLADGVLQLSSYSPSTPILPKQHVKAVGIASVGSNDYPNVRIDNEAAAKHVVEHLLSKGHKRIAAVTGPAENSNTQHRLRGYISAIEGAGISVDQALIYEGNFRTPSGHEAGLHFAKKANRPTAIFCMNDEMAIGVLDGLREAGLSVPTDVSVTGFDDIDMAKYMNPRLTTITQPAWDLGKRGAEILIGMIEGTGPADLDLILPFDFTVRDSVSVPCAKDHGDQ